MSTIVEEEIGEDSNNNSDNVFQADDVLAIGWREWGPWLISTSIDEEKGNNYCQNKNVQKIKMLQLLPLQQCTAMSIGCIKSSG